MRVVAIRDMKLGDGYWVRKGAVGVVVGGNDVVKKVRWDCGPMCDAMVGTEIEECRGDSLR